jgi:hypothetical protein
VRRRDLVRVLALGALLFVGVFAATALGAKPPTPPGSPGDDCSHGNSNQPCKPDPSTNGKDCEDHGNAKGNEDHCLSNSTSTMTGSSSTSTTSSTTTSPTSSSTTTAPSTSTPQGTTGSQTTTGSSSLSGASSDGATGGTTTQTTSGGIGTAVTVTVAAKPHGLGLPFTGLSLPWIVALGVGLLVASLLVFAFGLMRAAGKDPR